MHSNLTQHTLAKAILSVAAAELANQNNTVTDIESAKKLAVRRIDEALKAASAENDKIAASYREQRKLRNKKKLETGAW